LKTESTVLAFFPSVWDLVKLRTEDIKKGTPISISGALAYVSMLSSVVVLKKLNSC